MLGPGIGRHDGARRVDAARRRKLGCRVAEAAGDLVHRQRHADHAGREDECRPWWQTRCLFGGTRHCPRGFEAGRAGTGVRDARVHRDGADPARPVTHHLGVVDDGGRPQRVLREGAGGGATRRADEQRDVERAVRFQSGVGRRGGETAGRRRRAAVNRGKS